MHYCQKFKKLSISKTLLILNSPIYSPQNAAVAKSLQLCLTLCDPIDISPPGSPSLGFSRQEHWSGLPFPSPIHESEKWKWSRSVCLTLSNPMDCSLPGSLVHGICQARVLEWGASALPEGKNRRQEVSLDCKPPTRDVPLIRRKFQCDSKSLGNAP